MSTEQNASQRWIVLIGRVHLPKEHLHTIGFENAQHRVYMCIVFRTEGVLKSRRDTADLHFPLLSYSTASNPFE